MAASEPVAALRAAWQKSRRAFRAAFFQLVSSHPQLLGLAPVLLYRAIGDLLPAGLAEGAAVWGLCQTVAQRQPASLRRAGFEGEPAEAADALFDSLLTSKSAVVFSVDEQEESFARIATASGRIELAVAELFAELDSLAGEDVPGTSAEFPFVLSAGERRSFTANTIIRNPDWRKKDRGGALRMHPDDALRIGIAPGSRVRLSTRRGSAEVEVEVSDRMSPGHVSLPNGQGVDYPAEGGARVTGVAVNELTHGADRDWLAGTPWHKYTPARIEAL